MTGRQFEIFMAEVFKAVGYGVELTQATNDGGKDIILYRDGKKIFVECKRWSGDWLIGREILQKLAGASLAEKSDKMICITTGNYHRNAIEYAKLIDNLSLWDMQDVMETVDEVPKENIAWIMTKTFTPETKNMFANVAERSENI
jgi:HJR/Mrr/RecB family endonuclease